MATDPQDNDTLFEQLRRLTGQVAGGTLELARNTATMTAMFGETWLRNAVMNTLEPERLEAMVDAGRFLQDARETAGLSIKELAESIDLNDRSILEDIESGKTIMPLELMLRSASLLARHDPIPFLIKFMRTYNPALEQTLEQLGVLALPKQYERERRFVNLVRQHDVMRTLSDDEYDRFMDYMESSLSLVLDVMLKEKAVNAPPAKSKSKAKPKSRAKPKAKTRPKTKVKPKANTKSRTKSRTTSRTKS
ncbi:MAG: helix-turn-helix domain-containing protein [Halioglobus sp.]